MATLNPSVIATSQAASNQPKPNVMPFADLLTLATDLGTQAGHGKDTQIKFHMKMVEAAYQGVIDLQPSKHGTEVDDASKLVEAYVKAQGSATIFDAKAPNQRKAISLARTCIKLGQYPKGGAGEPLQTMNALMTHRQKLRSNPLLAKKLDDATNVLMKFARQQLKRDTMIDPTEFPALCMRKEGGTMSAEQIVERIRKQLTDLKQGKSSHGTAQDNSPEIVNAIDALNKRLANIAKARGGVQQAEAAE